MTSVRKGREENKAPCKRVWGTTLNSGRDSLFEGWPISWDNGQGWVCRPQRRELVWGLPRKEVCDLPHGRGWMRAERLRHGESDKMSSRHGWELDGADSYTCYQKGFISFYFEESWCPSILNSGDGLRISDIFDGYSLRNDTFSLFKYGIVFSLFTFSFYTHKPLD